MRTLLLIQLVLSLPMRSAASAASPTQLFVSGLGYCGLRTAIRWHEAYPECTISGSVRSKAKADALRAKFPWLEVYTFDLDDNYVGLDDGGQAALATASHVVQTMAPIADFDADPLLAFHRAMLLDSEFFTWAAYLSSTGVYGEHGGDWVDEGSELRPNEPKSKARALAEVAWMALSLEGHPGRPPCTVSVFRLGGIYGPGRSLLDRARRRPRLANAAATPPVPRMPWVNRVHVDDVAGALAFAASRTRREGSSLARVYSLVDDEPAPRSAVMSYARWLLGLTDADAGHDGSTPPSTRSMGVGSLGSKRVRNARLRGELGYKLVAPTYREGLALLLADEQPPEDTQSPGLKQKVVRV